MANVKSLAGLWSLGVLCSSWWRRYVICIKLQAEPICNCVSWNLVQITWGKQKTTTMNFRKVVKYRHLSPAMSTDFCALRFQHLLLVCLSISRVACELFCCADIAPVSVSPNKRVKYTVHHLLWSHRVKFETFYSVLPLFLPTQVSLAGYLFYTHNAAYEHVSTSMIILVSPNIAPASTLPTNTTNTRQHNAA